VYAPQTSDLTYGFETGEIIPARLRAICYRIPMISNNPNRTNGSLVKTAPVSKTLPQPNLQQVYDLLVKATQRITELEGRLQRFETCIYVSPTGEVEISSGTQIRIISGQTLEISGDRAVSVKDGTSNTIMFDAVGVSIRGSNVDIQDNNGNTMRLDAAGIKNTCPSRFSVDAGSMEISASKLETQSAMSKFAGVVQCDTIIANSVIGQSYTPGAGNIW
jgi:hypothetical protein